MKVAFLAMVPDRPGTMGVQRCPMVDADRCPEWKMTKGVDTGDMWLKLGELSAETDGYEHSWLTATLKATPTELCVAIKLRRGLQNFADAILQDEKAIPGLQKAGFKSEDD